MSVWASLDGLRGAYLQGAVATRAGLIRGAVSSSGTRRVGLNIRDDQGIGGIGITTIIIRMGEAARIRTVHVLGTLFLGSTSAFL